MFKEGARNSSDGCSGRRLRSAFVVAQVSLALVLLVGAGLMVKGFRALLDTNRRFQPESLLTLRLILPDTPLSRTLTTVRLSIRKRSRSSPRSRAFARWRWSRAFLFPV
jgi:hypothetical protein